MYLKGIITHLMSVPTVTTSVKIKIEMLRRGISGMSISRDLGVTPQAVYQTISGRRTGKRIRKAIANAIGIRWKDLWTNNHKRAA
jgi:predicted transcriptional regulator